MTEYLPDHDPDPSDDDPPISVMRTEEIAPRGVPQRGSALGRAHGVREQHGSEYAVRFRRGHARLMPEALG
jgi:hypothetical protein